MGAMGAGATNCIFSGATTGLVGAGRAVKRDLEFELLEVEVDPETAELTVCETRGAIWDTTCEIMSSEDVLVVTGRGAGAVGVREGAGRRDPATAEETV